MFEWLKKWWFGEKPKDTYPYHFLKVVLNPVAHSRGIKDEFNKEIYRIKEGKVVEIKDYSPALLEQMKLVYEIPVYEEEYEEEYEFDSFNELSNIIYKK